MEILTIADIQLAFAEAYAESKDAVAAARQVFAEVERLQGDIKVAVDAIRDFVLKGNPEADLPLLDEDEERLTAAERATIASLMNETLAKRPEISAGEMIEVIEGAGIKLRERYQNPAAFTANNMKRRLRQLSEAQPAATPASTPATGTNGTAQAEAPTTPPVTTPAPATPVVATVVPATPLAAVSTPATPAL